MAVTGQLWFTAEGDPTDARIAYINDDGTNQTVQVDNSPTTDLITGFVQEIGLDTAAGWYFAIVNGGNLGSGAHLVRGSIGTPGPVVDITIADFIVGNDPGDSNNDDVIVNALHVDNINEKIYVTYQDPNGDATKTGIRQYSYNPLTGAVTDDGFLVRADQDNTKPLANGGFDLLDVRDFDLDLTTNTLYFTELLTGGLQEMGLYRMDLTTKVITQMVSSVQFPDTGTNGYIIDVEVDPTTDLVYFTTESQAPFGAASGYDANQNAIWVVSQSATNATATKVTLNGLPGGAHLYPGDMVFDQNKRQIYVESEEGNSGSTDDVIYVFQLDGAGTTATLINTINQTPEFTNAGANFGGMAFDILAEITPLNPTTAHAVEQVTNLDLLLTAPTITDTDGDHLNNATVTISGSFIGSGDDLFISDGGRKISGTFTGTNITITRATDGAGNQKLTLSGYDTFANYQNVLNAVTFKADGDNPTNYGNNTTRTVTWQVNDGAAGNPSGTMDGTDTNVRTSTINIDAVDDAPVNNSLPTLTGAGSVTEDTGKQITFSVSDVDADPANQNITVRLQVTHGTIDINTTVGGGLTAGQVTGDNTNDVLLTGTQNQINATLANATGAVYHNTADYNGSDTLTVTTNDQNHTGSGGPLTDVDTVNININAVVDIANDSVTVGEDSGANTLNLLANDAFENPGRAITAVGTASHGTVTISDNGTAGDATDDFVVYTPSADYNGTDSFTYTVTSGGVTEQATVNVTVTAVADIANDSVTVGEDSGATNLDLLANDTFENPGRAITAVGAASHGTVTINDNGTAGDATDDFVVYTPTADYNGPDNFTYTVTSPAGVTEQATVNVTVTAVADIAGDTVTVGEDAGPTNLDLLANDTFENPGRAITAVGAASHGTVTINNNGTAGDATDDFVVYTPAADYNGSDSFTYTVTSGGVTEQATVNVTVTAVADIADDNVTVGEDSGANTLNLLANDSFENPGRAITAVGAALHGTVTINNNGTPGNAADDFVVYTPNANYNGSDTFTHTVTSPAGVTEQATVNVTVTAVNDAPQFAGLDGTPTFTEDGSPVVLDGNALISDVELDAANNYDGATLTLARNGGASVNDVFGATGLLQFSGGAGGSVLYNLTAVGLFTNSGGTLAITFNSNATSAIVDGVLQGITYSNPDQNPASPVQINYTFSDGNSGDAQGTGANPGVANGGVTVSFTADNDTPTVSGTSAFTGSPSTPITITGLTFDDVDGAGGDETATFTAAAGSVFTAVDGGGVVVTGSGTNSLTLTGTTAELTAFVLGNHLTFTAPANDTVHVVLNDNGHTPAPAESSAPFDIAINIGEPPVVGNVGQTVDYTEGQASPVVIDADLTLSDADAPTSPAAQIKSASISITGGNVAGDIIHIDVGATGIVVSNNDTNTVTVTGAATLADYEAVLRSATFTSSSDDPTNGGVNTTRTVTWFVVDVQDITSVPATSTINVTAVNDGPTALITPMSYSATEQTVLNLKNNGLSVVDVDADGGSVTVTLSVTEGTLNVTAGGSGAGVAGNGTSSVTLTGTVAQINALLTSDGASTVTYIDNTDNPSASATLTLAINDNGNTGGGSLTVQDTATINIAASNDAPAATITPPTYNATENVALSLKNNGLSVSDVDGNAGSMTVTLSVTEGILNVTAGGSGAIVTDSGTGSVTITGTLAQINALLNTDGTSTVQYVENDDTPSATATLTFAIHDNGNTGGGDLSAQDIATINITAVNDLPVVGNLTPSITYLVASPPQTLSSGATVTDPDSANLVSASVTLTDHQTGDELSVNGAVNGGPVNGISWTYTAATGVLLLVGSSSLANYQALLDQVQYRSTAADPSNGGTTLSRDVAWTVNDGTDPSVTQHTSISLGNQAPVVDLNGGGGGNNADQPFFEGAGAVGVASASMSIADPDDANLISATIVLTNAKAGDTLSITGSLPAGIASAIDTSVAGQITVTLSGSASKANYTTAIQQVVFNNASDNPDTTDRQITVTVNDGEVNSNSAITTVHVAGVNDAPVNTVPATQNIEANTATAISGLSISDPDAGLGTWSTTLSVTHGTLTVGSAGGAVVSGSGTASVTLSGSVAAINTTLTAANNVLYTGAHDFFGVDTLTVLTNDNGNTGAGGPLTDTDHVTLNINTLITGTPGNDSYNALPGQERIDAGLGIDTITFNFKLVDASVKYVGNQVIIDGPTGSHTVLTGFEVFDFTDGTVHNDDGSPLIDDLFYYSKYHGVWNAHIDADADYNSVGWQAGRDPNAFFQTAVYLSANPDVKAAGVNPLSHFDAFGWKEGRVPSITFDPAQYLAANPDAAAANIDPLRHFLANGYQEGRQPFAPSELVTANGFDYVYYLNNNPDVAAAGVDPFVHFQTVGWKEGRNPNALFDTNGYLNTYADVKAAGVNPLDHYNQFGWHEGRDPSVGFDTTSYLAAYADVNAAHVNPLTHFLHYGIHEGRSPFADGVWG